MNWRIRRQIVYLSFLGIILILISAYSIYQVIPRDQCFNGKQNRGEDGIDCGGECIPCIDKEAQELILVWSRFFEVRPGVYDIAALIENPNVIAGAQEVPYTFRIADKDNKTIENKKGVAYVLPAEEFLIYEAGVEIGRRLPENVSLEFKDFHWTRSERQRLPIVVTKMDRSFDRSRPQLVVTLQNNTINEIRDVDVQVILSDFNGNAIGVGTSEVIRVPDSGSAEAVFTWPEPLPSTVRDVRTFVRQNPWRHQ